MFYSNIIVTCFTSNCPREAYMGTIGTYGPFPRKVYARVVIHYLWQIMCKYYQI